ncbi:MAG TPA: S8 family serine peptidase [Bacteroidia bacterium]
MEKNNSAMCRLSDLCWKIYRVACLFVVCSLLIVNFGFSQTTSYTKYFIQFTDKTNTPYSLSNPSAYLSSRAIQRRQNQGIVIAQNDLPVDPVYVDSIAKIPYVTVLNHSKWFNGVVIATTDTNALKKINAYPFVLKTDPVKRVRGNKGKVQREKLDVKIQNSEFRIQNNETGKSNAQNISSVNSNVYNYGPSYTQINQLDGVCLHNKGFHGEGMVIAVMDAGFYNANTLPAFDSLRVNHQILGKWNFVDNDSLVWGSHTHGEMTLSCMGGNMPGQLVGTAPKALYWLFITEDANTENVIEEYNWLSAAEVADSAGADVLSTSLGYTQFDSVQINGVTVANPASHTYADMNGHTCVISIAHNIAASKGMIPVCSAGNSGWDSWHFIGAPADADSSLAIGAVDSLGNVVGFSSRGPSYDGRVKPNVAAQGQDAVVGDPNTGGITRASGTSFSCPITAGMTACLWQAHPTSKNMDLFNAIEQSGNRHTTPDSLSGYGIPDFCIADILLGINDLSATAEDVLSVYPNPFKDGFDISFIDWKGEKVSFALYDLDGKKVMEKQVNSNAGISNLSVKGMEGLKAGVYVLKLYDGKRNYSEKLIKY